MEDKPRSWFMRHRILTVGVLVVVAGGGVWGWRAYTSPTEAIRYVLGRVRKGDVVAAVSGTGQVSAASELEVKPEVSGRVIAVVARVGQTVQAGDVLVRLDDADARKTVRDAEVSLASSRLSLAKVKAPADALALLQARNALVAAEEAKTSAEADLEKAYDDGYTAVSSAFLDLPAAVPGIEDVLYKTTINSYQWNVDAYADAVKDYDERVYGYKADAIAAAQRMRAAYDANVQAYKASTRDSGRATTEALLTQTYATVKAAADAAKSTNNLIDFALDILTTRNLRVPTQAAGHRANLSTHTDTLNGHLSALLTRSAGIQGEKDAIVASQRSIAERTESLAELEAGADPLDVQSQELSVRTREIALADARAALADYAVKAPIDGVIAKMDVRKGEIAGPSTAVATVLAGGLTAEISLNEVDAAKVTAGQRVSLTFDAMDDVTATGTVAEVEGVGAVSQGVVSYVVRIVFTVADERVKSGMSVSATMVTDERVGVLTVPVAAVKTDGDARYVEVLDMPAQPEGEEAGAGPGAPGFRARGMAGTASGTRDALSVTGGRVRARMGDSATDTPRMARRATGAGIGQGVAATQGIPSDTPPRRVEVTVGLANDEVAEILSGLTGGERIVVRTIDPAKQAAASTQATSGFRLFGGGGGGAPSGNATRAR